MDTCRATRLIAVALLVAIVVSTVGGSDLLAWIAAAVTVAVLVAFQRLRGTGASCAVRPREAPAQHSEPPPVPGPGR